MRYEVIHKTTFEYREQVLLCWNLAHLTPRESPFQSCRQTALHCEPAPAVLSARVDYFGNPETFFIVQEPHRTMSVTASHLVEVAAAKVPEPSDTPHWEAVRDQLAIDREPGTLEAYEFVFDSHYVQSEPALADYARESFPLGRPLLEAVLELNGRIHADFAYDPLVTTVATPLQKVFAERRGVCQDFAHLAIAFLRSLGLAARYVSGYFSTRPPPGQARIAGADASHAWISVYCPGAGWVEFDPTNNQVVSDQHIVLAYGRDYDDVSPIRGVILGGGQHSVTVAVDVVPSEPV